MHTSTLVSFGRKVDDYFAKKAHIKRLKNDWKLVFVKQVWWNEDGVRTDTVIYSLYENGLNQRKAEIQDSSGFEQGKDHIAYKLRILPWLNGVVFKGYPEFRHQETYRSKTYGNVVHVNFGGNNKLV